MALKKPAAKSKRSAPQLAHASWRLLGRDYLLTNDSGSHAWLSKRDFALASAGRLKEGSPLFTELSSKGFIRNRLDFERLAAEWRGLNGHLGSGPGLHIFVLTLRCDHKCVYCQSGAVGVSDRSTDMTPAVARKCVDFAFNSPNPGITIEFQGGEPLLNWTALKAAVTYARRKARLAGKELKLALTSNFTPMTEEKAAFLLKNEVSVCTSLDGPAGLHKSCRTLVSGDSHANAVRWLKYFQARAKAQGPGARIFEPAALLTVTRASLGMHREIIGEYARLGLRDIFIRPLAPIGYARRIWDRIGYGPKEFGEFYLKCLDHILSLNRAGTVMRERMAAMMLEKILNHKDPGYLDSRCPCGAAIGQLAYNYNGDIYSCDEGRMLGWSGDETFRLGSVLSDGYRKIVGGAAARSCVLSSDLEAQPVCARCAYKPYCGVCPVYNYGAQGSLWGDMPSNDRCGIFKGIFDALFTLLRDPRKARILEKWTVQK